MIMTITKSPTNVTTNYNGDNDNNDKENYNNDKDNYNNISSKTKTIVMFI